MRTTNERAQRPEWLVRVPRGDGTAAGAGVLLDQHHVVTCAHVIARQLGEPTSTAGTGPAPDSVVTVEFPFTGDALVRRAARVVGWRPIAEDQSGDTALLRLVEPVMLTPAPLAFPAHVQGHRFSVHGFPGGDVAARQASGRLGGASGPTGGWVQLDADSGVGWAVEHGFSGAPVFDHDVGAVVGIVVMTDAHRSGHMLPMSALRSWWPRLFAWRVDDASWQGHWLPRARGSERQSDTGVWYFTGRVAARQRVCDWLADPSQPALVVTGGPGTGKSALLAHLLVCSDPEWADAVPTAGPRPLVGAFDFAVHVSGLSCEDVVDRVATTVGLEVSSAPELLAALRQRRQAGQPPMVMVADAVEEAASIEEGRQIAILLRNLAGTGAVRVLAGVRTAPMGTKRAAILDAFGTIPHLALESRAFQRNEDVADYVRLRLTDDDIRGHYRIRPSGELRKIGWAVARRARYNFLIAQLTTLWLTQATTPPLDLADPGWDQTLPQTVGEAMDEYIRHCGADPARVRRVLTALAFARGNGLALDRTWLVICDALHPADTHTLADLETVFHSAANYLIERTNDRTDQPSYRLYHHALDEHLRDHHTKYTPQPNPQRAITRALTDAVPPSAHGRDWAVADVYTRTHLAGHAAEAHQLDDVLNDPIYLLYAEPGPLLTALPLTRTEQGRLTGAVYRLSEHHHRHTHPVDRCRILALDAARLGARDLQHHLNTIHRHLTGPDRHTWRVRFATGSTLPTAALATLTGHTGAVQAVAVAELDGCPIAVTGGSDGTVRIWDLAEQRAVGKPLTCHGYVRAYNLVAVAVTELDGRPIAVTGGGDGTMRMWDLTEQCQIGAPLTGDILGVQAVGVAELDGRPIAVTGGSGSTVQIWDLTEQCQIGAPLTGHSHKVRTVAVAELDGRPIAVTSGGDGTMRMWDLTEQCQIGAPITSDIHGVRAVAVAKLDGRPVAVSGGFGDDEALRIWDLAERREVGHPLIGHIDGVDAVAVAELDGRPIAVTGGVDGTVRIWDLGEQHHIGAPLTGHTVGVAAVAVTELDGRPIAVSGGRDGTVRIWDLGEQHHIGDPFTGHTGAVQAVAVAELDGRPIAVTGGSDGTVRTWDPIDQCAVGNPLTGHSHGVRAVAVSELDGRPIAVTGDGEGTVRIWDLGEQHHIGDPFTGHTGAVQAVAVAELDGHPIAVTGGSDGTVRIWDLGEQHHIGDPFTGHSYGVVAVAVAELDGHPIAVTSGGGSGDKTVQMWGLSEQRALGIPVTVHTGEVYAVAVAELDGRPIAVTGGSEGTVRIWDLTEQHHIGAPLTGHSYGVVAVAVAELDGHPIAVTGSHDGTVRTWDLKNRRCLDELTMPGYLRSLALGARGTLVVSFSFDIAVFDASTPITIRSVPKLSRHSRWRHWWRRIAHR